MYCPECGREQSGNPDYCRDCGARMAPTVNPVDNPPTDYIKIKLTSKGKPLTDINVIPIFPVKDGGFIITGEGIYARQKKRNETKTEQVISRIPLIQFWVLSPIRKGRVYRFYPWSSLHLHRIDERKSTIGLYSERDRIKLNSKHDFTKLLDTIMSYIPKENQRVDSTHIRRYRYALLVGLLIALIATQQGLSAYYESISSDKAGCDICGNGGYGYGEAYYTIESWSGEEIHDYCPHHMWGYALINPKDSFVWIFTAGLDFFFMSFASILLWFLILKYIEYFSRTKWYRTRLLKQ